MAVPETSIYLNHRFVTREYKIRPTRKPFDMQAVTKTPRMQALPNQEFRLGILAPDP